MHVSSVWRDTLTPENMQSARLLALNHYVCEIFRKAKYGYGKEEQMITVPGIKVPWEGRQGKRMG